jgi:hypothetical protein
MSDLLCAVGLAGMFIGAGCGGWFAVTQSGGYKFALMGPGLMLLGLSTLLLGAWLA